MTIASQGNAHSTHERRAASLFWQSGRIGRAVCQACGRRPCHSRFSRSTRSIIIVIAITASSHKHTIPFCCFPRVSPVVSLLSRSYDNINRHFFLFYIILHQFRFVLSFSRKKFNSVRGRSRPCCATSIIITTPFRYLTIIIEVYQRFSFSSRRPRATAKKWLWPAAKITCWTCYWTGWCL